MRRDDLPLAAAGFAAVAAVLALFGPDTSWLRVLFGVPLALLLPGLPLALAPSGALERLGSGGRLAVAIGASLVIDMAAGLALSFVGIALTPQSTVLSIAAVAVLGNGALSHQLTRAGRREPSEDALPLLGTGLALVGVATLIVLLGSASPVQPTYGEIVQLWALPAASGSETVTVGVRNVVSDLDFYHLRISQGHDLLLNVRVSVPKGTSRTFLVRQSSATTDTPLIGVLSNGNTGAELRTVELWPPDRALPGQAASNPSF